MLTGETFPKYLWDQLDWKDAPLIAVVVATPQGPETIHNIPYLTSMMLLVSLQGWWGKNAL